MKKIPIANLSIVLRVQIIKKNVMETKYLNIKDSFLLLKSFLLNILSLKIQLANHKITSFVALSRSAVILIQKNIYTSCSFKENYADSTLIVLRALIM